MTTFREKAEAAGVKVLAADELKVVEPEVPYLSAGFTFLNRDSGEQKVMAYPITRIELYRRMTEENPHGEPTRVFVVGEDGEWKEQLR
jgi:hypothetical protein